MADLGGLLLVLPGMRSIRRLRELLAEAAAGRGLRLIPPRMATAGRIPELLAPVTELRIEGPAATICWAESLRSIAPERLATLFRRRPDPEQLREWMLMANEIARLHETVSGAGLRFADVARRCGELPGFRDVARWEVLHSIQVEYERRARASGLVDRHLVAIDALRAGEPRHDPGDIWLIGVSELPPLVRSFLDSHVGTIQVLIQAPESHRELFDRLGCVVPTEWTGAEIHIPDDRLMVVQRPHDQALEVCRFLSQLEGARAPDEIVIGVPDPDVLPHIEHGLAESGISARPATGRRLADSGPYRLLGVLADFLESRRWEAFAALIRHPHLAEWLQRRMGPTRSGALPVEALDRYASERLPAILTAPGSGHSRDGGSPASAPSSTGEDDLAAVMALATVIDQELAGDLGGELHLSDWMLRVLAVLESVYAVEEGTREGGLGDTPVAKALTRLADRAAEFMSLPRAFDPALDAPSAIRVLLESAGRESIPAPDDPEAIELVGWLELHLDDSPVQVVTGVNEGRLPAAVHSDPFLPDRLRTALGLEDDARRYARDAYRLSALVGSVEELFLTAGRRSASGDPLRPSRLLFALPATQIASRVERFYGDASGAAPGIAHRSDGAEAVVGDAFDANRGVGHGPEAGASERADGFTLPPERRLRLSLPLPDLRVTDFARLLADPFQWVIERHLGLAVADDGAREFDPLSFGTIAHRVLERFGSDPAAETADLDRIISTLDRELDLAARRVLAPQHRVAAQIQVDLLRARLHSFARWHATWVEAGWRVAATEVAPEGGAKSLDVDGDPVRITAKVDRVDFHPDLRAWAVFDYKTSEKPVSPRKAHGPGRDGAWKDLQLPLYHWMLPELVRGERAGERAGQRVMDPGLAYNDIEVGYIFLPGELAGVGEQLADWSREELADALEAARSVVRMLREGVVEFDPTISSRWSDPRLDALLGRGMLGAREPTETGASWEAGADEEDE